MIHSWKQKAPWGGGGGIAGAVPFAVPAPGVTRLTAAAAEKSHLGCGDVNLVKFSSVTGNVWFDHRINSRLNRGRTRIRIRTQLRIWIRIQALTRVFQDFLSLIFSLSFLFRPLDSYLLGSHLATLTPLSCLSPS